MNFAFVNNATGVPGSVITVAPSDFYYDGKVIDENTTIREFPQGIGHIELLEGYAWDNELNSWKVLPPKPEDNREYQVWNGFQWVADLSRVESSVRSKRQAKLSECDWTILPDSPIANKEEWTAYRRELRDITLQAGFPLNVIWPVEPVKTYQSQVT